MNHEQTRSEIENSLRKKVADDPKLHHVQMLLHSEKLDIHAGQNKEGCFECWLPQAIAGSDS